MNLILNLHKELFLQLLEKRLIHREINYYDSFSSIAEELLKLNADINFSKETTAKILERSREDYLKLLKYSIKRNILSKYNNSFKNDFKRVLKLLSDSCIEFDYIDIVLDTVLKKISLNYFKEVQFVLDNEKRMDFKDIKLLVNDVFQEICQRNIPIETVRHFIKADSENICIKLNEICSQESESQVTYALFNVKVPDSIINEAHFSIQNILFIKCFDKDLNLVDESIPSNFQIEPFESLLRKNNFKPYGKKIFSGLYLVDLSTIEGFDNYSKIRLVTSIMESELLYFSKLSKKPVGKLYHPTSVIYHENSENISYFSISEKPVQNLKNQSSKFQKDKEDFLEYYIDLTFREGKNITSLKSIFNLLNLLDSVENLTSGNKLVILWSCMEKVAVDMNEKSIISKIIKLNIKATAMYSLKNDLNHIWYQIKNDDVLISLFFDAVKDTTGGKSKYKYDAQKFVELLRGMNEDDQKKIKEVSLILYADIYELLESLSTKNKLVDYIKQKEDSVAHEFTRIYRHRNLLVHTNTEDVKNIEFYIQALSKYLNSLISIMIHYSLRNKNITIKDVLYSIDSTYIFLRIVLKIFQLNLRQKI